VTPPGPGSAQRAGVEALPLVRSLEGGADCTSLTSHHHFCDSMGPQALCRALDQTYGQVLEAALSSLELELIWKQNTAESSGVLPTPVTEAGSSGERG